MINVGLRAIGIPTVIASLDTLASNAKVNADYYVGTDVHYAPYVEFGTYKMQAQPFLRPSADEVRGNLTDIVSRQSDMDAALKAVALEVEGSAKKRCPVDTGNLRGSIRTTQQ